MVFWQIHRWFACSLAVLTWTLAVPSSSTWAQKPKTEPAKGKSDKPGLPDGLQSNASMEITKLEGKFDAFGQGIIKILDADNKEIFLRCQNDALISYTAEAEPAWLMPGYMVRLSASFDQKNKLTEPVKEVEVFTPNVRRRMSPELMREQMPGIYQEGKQEQDGNNAPGEKGKTPQPPFKGKPTPKKESIVPGQPMRIVGQIVGFQNDVLTIASAFPIQIELDPAAKVTVTASDLNSALSMMAKGDSVSVSGLRNPAQPAQVYCEQLTVKAGKKLTQILPQAKRGKGSTRDSDKDKDKDTDTKNSKDSKTKPDPKKPNASEKKT